MKRISVIILVLLACSDGSELLEIEATDQMTYSVQHLEAKAGQEVTLRLRHVGRSPRGTMGHNVVIVRPGTDIAAFATAAISAGSAQQYIPSGHDSEIIAHTELVGGGETTEVSFVAPAPGTYPFFCSFPGHFAAMRGELVVTP